MAKIWLTQNANLRSKPVADTASIIGVLPKASSINDATLEGDYYKLPTLYLHKSVVKEVVDYRVQPDGQVIPYRSQWDADANNRVADCGQTCVAMLAEYAGVKTHINDLRFQTTEKGMSTSQNLIDNFKSVGLNARTEKLPKNVLPPLYTICLVNYGAFSRSRVQDKNYTGNHWLIFLGENGSMISTNDPDWWGDRRDEGRGKEFTRNEFLAAFTGEYVALA